MPDLYITIGSTPIRSFTLFVALAVIGGTAFAAYRSGQPGAVVDACLGALIGGVAGARLAHVLLNWTYFSEHTDEIARLNAGGLEWHGSLFGGLLGLALAARWRGLDTAALLDLLAPVLPVLALSGWLGCWAWACGYGAEVDTLARYPAYAVSEARDVYGIIAPRYNTQAFGVVLALVTGLVAVVLMRRRVLYGVRFWLVLALLGAGMALIGTVRGDAVPSMAGVRADLWLDLVVIVLALGQCTLWIIRRRSAGG